MNEEEIRKILAASRPHNQDATDPLVAEALEQAKRNPAISRWFEQEREFDRRFADAFAGAAIPPGLKAKILATEQSAARRHLQSRRIGWAVAAIGVLLVLFSSWRGPFEPAASLADFRSEMVSFVKLPPPLELESSHLDKIQHWLNTAGAPASVSVPPGLAELEPVGCRVLFFRRHTVTLICFRRAGTRLVHLMVIDQSDLFSRLRSGEKPVFAREGDWMTAAWREGNRAYLLAAQGDETLIERYLQ